MPSTRDSQNSPECDPNYHILVDRKRAAVVLGGDKPLNPGTLAVWDCTGRYNLQPIKVGRHVRYRLSVLLQLLQERQRPA